VQRGHAALIHFVACVMAHKATTSGLPSGSSPSRYLSVSCSVPSTIHESSQQVADPEATDRAKTKAKEETTPTSILVLRAVVVARPR
jgi:hypothetical protein